MPSFKLKTHNNSHATAMTRNKLSAPLFMLVQKKCIKREHYILDYGCGKGDDTRYLINKGYEIEGYDPTWQPIAPMPDVLYDRITCTYVLNVIEGEEARLKVVEDVIRRLKPCGRAYFSVRRDIKEDGLTLRGTYQCNVTMCEKSFTKIYSKGGSFAIYEYRAACPDDESCCC